MSSSLSFLNKVLIKIFKGVNTIVPWHKLPKLLGEFNLLALRVELDNENLYDVYPDGTAQGTKATCPMSDPRYLVARNSDGMYNSLDLPKMGCSGMRLGRNVPRSFTQHPSEQELLIPSPRLVSEQLLQRTAFKPATIVNLLAAAWIQFQVHDWFFHETYDPGTHDVDIPLSEADLWPSGHMKVSRTKPDAPLSKLDIRSPAYKNMNTAWWDGSQIYGSTEAITTELRNGAFHGKLAMKMDGTEDFLLRDASNLPLTGFNQNWWLGLELLHTLFALEHNAICDMLLDENPTFSSDQIFDTARIINCALMAKIHTTEWTPAILKHPTLNAGMQANWWGLIGEKLNKLIGRVAKNELIGGIPGSGVDMASVPFSLTEEFVSVYRLHPLIPDNIAFFNANTGAHTKTMAMEDVAFQKAQDAIDPSGSTSIGDALYSFGINYPGAITHHNTPNFLRNLHSPNGTVKDLGSIDILRDRERGIPRFCEFKRLFHMKPPTTFVEMTGGDVALGAEISAVYDGDIEKVDLQVGMFVEPLPAGFGFSDTAFRVFILMASRRLKTDRFLAGDGWTEKVYTKAGMKYVQDQTMVKLLLRHFPELEGGLKGQDNAFRPWNKVGVAGEYKGVETNA